MIVRHRMSAWARILAGLAELALVAALWLVPSWGVAAGDALLVLGGAGLGYALAVWTGHAPRVQLEALELEHERLEARHEAAVEELATLHQALAVAGRG